MEHESVLIVDDDPELRLILEEMVVSLGYGCATAPDAESAMQHIRTAAYDIIITDIYLPGMNGLQLIQRVRLRAADIPFIVITGYDQYTYDMVIDAGANDFIKKPFTCRELEKKLKRIFKERRLALENRKLLKKQQAATARLADLLEASLLLTAERDFDRLFTLIVGLITRALNAERTSLYLIDREHKELWTKVAEQARQIRVPIGQGISGRVAATGETINCADVRSLPYFDPSFDIKYSFRTQSVLCMPVMNRTGECIAVIQVINKQGPAGFTATDEELLRSLGAQVQIALENSRLLDELKLSFESAVRALSATVDARHRLTAGHSQRVTEYSLMIAREMGLSPDEQEVIKYAGLLHDIGKIGIADDVLRKVGPFSPAEREAMNSHPLKTRTILEKFRFPQALAQVPYIAAHHHEKINGQGYPDGLSGRDIPLASRILAVADVFDALTSARDYPKYAQDELLSSEPLSLEKAIQMLEQEAGSHFDPAVVAPSLSSEFTCSENYIRVSAPPEFGLHNGRVIPAIQSPAQPAGGAGVSG